MVQIKLTLAPKAVPLLASSLENSPSSIAPKIESRHFEIVFFLFGQYVVKMQELQTSGKVVLLLPLIISCPDNYYSTLGNLTNRTVVK